MLKHLKLFLILITLLYLPLQSFGQATPQIAISPTPMLQNAQVLYFSNLDLFDLGNPQYLFDVRILNVTQDWPDTRISLELQLGTHIVATAESDPFLLEQPPSGTSWSANNIELINAQTFPGSQMVINFSTTSLTPPGTGSKPFSVEVGGSTFEDDLYGSGKASSGKYILRGKLENDAWTSNPPPVEIVLIITNPSNIQLSTPGNRAGSGTPDETTDFPVFTFFSDGDDFILKIFEKMAHHQSVEDVINSSNPICEEPLNVSILDYATANTGQPLQVGKTYYWYVDVLVPTTAGTETFRSEVFQFKVTQGTGSTGEGTAVTSILEMLRPIVGNQVDNFSKSLSDYELKNIRLNGKPITIYELYQIIDGYEGHLVEILELGLY